MATALGATMASCRPRTPLSVAQIGASLAKQIDGIIADLPAILTPFGPLHVNDLEVHSTLLQFWYQNL